MNGLNLISTYIIANASDSLVIDAWNYLREQGELSATTPKLVHLGDYLEDAGLHDTGCYYMAILPDGRVAGVSQTLGGLVDDWGEFARLVRENNLWEALDIAPIADAIVY